MLFVAVNRDLRTLLNLSAFIVCQHTGYLQDFIVVN